MAGGSGRMRTAVQSVCAALLSRSNWKAGGIPVKGSNTSLGTGTLGTRDPEKWLTCT